MNFLLSCLSLERNGENMDIFIYFSTDPDVERDFIEERLDEILENKGVVTGGGAGVDGTNIDIELEDDNGNEETIKAIQTELIRLKMPADTYLVIDGKKHKLYGF